MAAMEDERHGMSHHRPVSFHGHLNVGMRSASSGKDQDISSSGGVQFDVDRNRRAPFVPEYELMSPKSSRNSITWHFTHSIMC